MSKAVRRFLFLDRDGVINRMDEGRYVNSLADFEFIEGVLDAMNILTRYFDRIVVVTNQAGVGYGYLKRETLESIHEHMIDAVEAAGGHIDKAYYCPDRVSKGALCRKPNPGMALQAKRDFPEIDFSMAWMVGDMATDIEFGKNLAMKTAFLTNGNNIQDLTDEIDADYYFENLNEFAHWLDDTWKEKFTD